MMMKACTTLDQELYIYRLDVSMLSPDRDVDRGNETEAWYSTPTLALRLRPTVLHVSLLPVRVVTSIRKTLYCFVV